MKRNFLSLILAITTIVSIQAQTDPNVDNPLNPNNYKPGSDEYDTLVVFNPVKDAGFPLWDDSITYSWFDSMFFDYWVEFFPDNHCVTHMEPDTVVVQNTVHYTLPFLMWKYFELKTDGSEGGYPKNYQKNVIASGGNISEFAQPWHFDTASFVCGVYADIKKDYEHGCRNMPRPEYFHLMDTAFKKLAYAYQIAYTNVTITDMQGNILSSPDSEYHHFYFQNHKKVKIKDFYISAEVNEISKCNTVFGGHSCSIYDPDTAVINKYKILAYPYDTIFVGRKPLKATYEDGIITSTQYSGKEKGHKFIKDILTHEIIDTIPLYQAKESPLLKREDRWIKFADDSLYYQHQKMVLKFLPIILVPKAEKDASSLNDAVLEDNLWVYPNPAKDKLNVKSGFKMQRIEVFNTTGNKIFSSDVSGNEVAINLTEFEKGVYFINIQTTRGTTTRKFIKQ